MKANDLLTNRRLRGNVSIFVAAGMIPIMGFVALALELGNMTVHQRRLQNYVDSMAVAALKHEFREGPEIQFYQFVDGEPVASSSQFDVTAEPVEGIWNFNTAGEAFTASSPLNLSPGEVPAFQFEIDPYPVPLLWGPLFNVPSADLRAEAIAYSPRREVVIVIDRSGSMIVGNPSRMEQAQQAATSAVTTMANQSIPGDRMGVLAFDSEDALTEMTQPGPGLLPLTPANATNINNFINGLTPTGTTDIPTGLDQGYTYFGNGPPDDAEVERLVILIGDGPDDSNDESIPEASAENAFNTSGIHTFAIAFCGDQQCDSNVTDFYDGIQAGDGTFQAPDNPAELGVLLARIITNVPLKLVR